MRFGTRPIGEVMGAILAHSVPVEGGIIRKGTRLGADHINALAAAGVAEVTAAAMEPCDVDENVAAARLAHALCGVDAGLEIEAAFTGRVNIRSRGVGVVSVDAAKIAAVNAIDPRITVATLPPWQRVSKGTMVATIKMIPYAVPEAALSVAEQAASGGALAHIAPQVSSAALILTSYEGQKAAMLEAKSIAAVEARLSALQVELCGTRICTHDKTALEVEISQTKTNLLLILTASATSDIDDVMPAALRGAGGKVTRFGMPVDPGNLLVLGALGAITVIGLPGCARSPALNGADWVLERVICGHPPTAEEIGAMGVGGLLKEIPTRPQPRDGRRR
ncbi:MAG: molybdopterin-binding protein [Proteobacteria bacterium]|nr:molybdopterin-binding protein [Pseudomonadota bacterium]